MSLDEGFFARDHWLPHVTAAAVADALRGFQLQCPHSMEWLATAVRRALAITIRDAEDQPDRQSNSDTKRELARLAALAAKVWLAIQNRSAAADDGIFHYVWRISQHPEDEDDIFPDLEANRRFEAALAELEWLSIFLRDAASNLESQAPRWREADARELRIERAQYLAPIYQMAFGLAELTGFGDFYQRMVALAFGEGDIPDFEAMISEARRRHSQTPFSFNENAGIPQPY